MSARLRRATARRRRGRRWSAAASRVAVVVLCGTVANVSSAGGQEPDRSVPECDLAVPVSALPSVLGEASGIARDPRRPDVFWLHNDSGNGLTLFAVDTTGALLATVPVMGASGVDPEDIAVGRCRDSWCLYLGDIGDNRARRSSIRVHRLPLPELPAPKSATGATPGGPVTPLASWELVFPDGPRDAEGLAVDDARNELLLLTKGREGRVDLYVASIAELEGGEGPATSLRRIGRLAIPVGLHTAQFVTAADLSPDGLRLAVRSYTTLFLFPWCGSAEQDTASSPVVISLVPAFEPQGEGLGWGSDGSVLYLASEGRDGRPPQLSRIRCPRR